MGRSIFGTLLSCDKGVRYSYDNYLAAGQELRLTGVVESVVWSKKSTTHPDDFERKMEACKEEKAGWEEAIPKKKKFLDAALAIAWKKAIAKEIEELEFVRSGRMSRSGGNPISAWVKKFGTERVPTYEEMREEHDDSGETWWEA